MKVKKKDYGPYQEKDGRKTVVLMYADGTRKKTSYARHLWETHHGIILNDDVTVDHIDEDHTNDVLSNLQLLTSKNNKQKHMATKASKFLSLTCIGCGASFDRSERKEKERKRRDFAGPFCAKECSGRYGRKQQLDGAAR